MTTLLKLSSLFALSICLLSEHNYKMNNKEDSATQKDSICGTIVKVKKINNYRSVFYIKNHTTYKVIYDNRLKLRNYMNIDTNVLKSQVCLFGVFKKSKSTEYFYINDPSNIHFKIDAEAMPTTHHN